MLSVTTRILSQKESFPGSEFKPASIWTCWMLIDRQMQSASRNFTGGFRSWLPATCKVRDQEIFDHHGKGNGNFVKKRASKNEKKSYLSLIWKRWKREMTARLPVTVSSLQTWFLHVALCKEIFARKHTATHKPTSAQPPPPIVTTMTHTHTHTHTTHTHTPTHLQDR